MSFIKTSSFDVVRLSKRVVWITGIELTPANTTGTIGFAGASGTPPDILLPEGFGPGAAVDSAPLAGRVRVSVFPNSADGLTNLPVSIQKTGQSIEAFRIALVNTNQNLTTQVSEIYVEIIEDDAVPCPTSNCVTVNVTCG